MALHPTVTAIELCAGVGAYEPVCPECRKSLEQAGILKPAGEPVQIGPLDV